MVGHEHENRNRLKNTTLKDHDIALIEELGHAKKINLDKKKKKRIIYCENSDDERIQSA